MRTKIEWCELHSPLFLAGTNLGQKLDPSKRTGLSMEFDEEKEDLFVSFNGRTCRVPKPAIQNMVEAKPVAVIDDARLTAIKDLHKPIEAQVSTPQSHVFAGPGGGTTGQEVPRKK